MRLRSTALRLRPRRAARGGAGGRFASTPQPGPDTPWRQAPWCAIDLELTGLNPRTDEIVAIGAVPISDGQLILGEAFYTLARPARPSKTPAVLIHKLRSADLAGAPPVGDAVDELLEVLAGRVPVFHTAIVEQTFLGRELRRRGAQLPRDADTEALGHAWLRERDGDAPAGLSLTRLASLLGQPAEDPHHALGDALTTAKAFIALASHLDVVQPQTVRSLQEIEPVVRGGARRFGPS